MIVRGGLDMPLMIGDVKLPKEARLQQNRFAGRMDNLEVLDMVSGESYTNTSDPLVMMYRSLLRDCW